MKPDVDYDAHSITKAEKDDARLMLAYAANTGIELPREQIQALDDVIEGKTDQDGATVSSTDFWISFSAISKKIAPVTTESLRCCVEHNNNQTSPARRAAYRYNRWGYTVLIILFFVQGYWFVLNTIADNFKQNHEVVKRYAIFGSAVEKKLRDELKRDPTPEEISAERKNLFLSSASSAELLMRAEKSESTSGPSTRQIFSISDESFVIALQETSLNALGHIAGWFSWLVYPKTKADDDFFYFNLKAKNLQDIQSAQFILDLLNRYWLPILYGLMGASLYVIRSLATEIRNMTYTKSSNIGFNLRFFLGGIAGMAIAWFVLPNPVGGPSVGTQTSTVFSSLSPLALSFVAGYAVEIFFSLVDRMVSSFTPSAQVTDGRRT